MPLCTAKKASLRRRAVSLLGRVALTGSLVALASCADYWPDNLSPDDWYATTMGEEPAPRSDEPVPGQDEDYPNLAEVPDAPVNISTAAEIDAVAEALSADLANAQYSSSLQRVDDETTPAAMPEPVIVEEEEEVTVIEPGGEIEIAEAVTVAPPPAPEVVEEEVVIVEQQPASPPSETVIAVAEETLVVAPAPQAEPVEAAMAEPVQSRLETETIHDESGELVGTVTRVVASREVVVEEAAAVPPVEVIEEAAAVVEQPPMEPEAVEETLVVAPAPAQAAEATVVAETMVADETVAVVAGTSDGGSQSLVAQSERTTTDNVVVVPEYVGEAMGEAEMAALETASEIETMSEAEAELQAAVAAEARAMEPVPDEAPAAVAEVEQAVVVDDGGELVGAVTRTVTVEEEVVVVPEGETAAAASGQAVVEETVAVEVTGAPAATAAQLDFDDLFAASGPTAGTAAQPLVVAEVPTTGGTDAAFTSAGAGMAQTLAAIIRFGNGSSALGSAERDIIRQIATIHAQRGGVVRLVGHASRTASGMESSGQQLANFNISLDRATAVAEELIRQGVPRDAVIVEAAGDSTATSLDAAGDRRVDIFIGA